MQRTSTFRPRTAVLTAVLALIATTLCPVAAPAGAADAPAIRINQLGYFRTGPRRATLVNDAETPLPWALRNDRGAVIATGTTTPAGFDASAGLTTHVIDFSDVPESGSGFRLTVPGAGSFRFRIGVDGVYERLATDAIEYFYLARSGIAIDAGLAGAAYARPAGHASAPGAGQTNQGDLRVGCADTRACPPGYALDVIGGWYDAGDHGKYVVSGAVAVAQLMASYERSLHAGGPAPHALNDEALAIPERGNGVPDVLDEARWELEWMLTMRVPSGTAPFVIDGRRVDVAGLVHHKVHDVHWTGLPLLPDRDDARRVLAPPSTAATLDFAAVAAQGARLWQPYDPEFAAELLLAATHAFDKARAFPRALYAPAVSEGGGAYDDTTVADEFYWAAAELYLSTGADRYRDLVVSSPMHRADVFTPTGFTWRNVAPLARLDLATVPNELPGLDTVRASVVAAADELVALQADQSMGHPYAGSNGRYEWGSNAQVLSNVVVLTAAADITGAPGYRNGAVEGVDYVFGRNALGRSYVAGYGQPGHTSRNHHSRWWAAQLDDGLPPPPSGALAGGPNSATVTWDPVLRERFPGRDCAPQQCYVDDIGSWASNELAVNWNAVLARVALWLASAGGR